MIIPLIAGILSGHFYSSELAFKVSAPVVFFSLLTLIFLVINYKALSIYRSRAIVGIVLHVFIFAIGYWVTTDASEKYETAYFTSSRADAFLAEIKNEPKLSGDIFRFEAQIVRSIRSQENNISNGKIIISVQIDSAKALRLNYGDLLLIPAVFNSIDPPYNPGEFDYRSYLANHQIYHQFFLKQNQLILIDRNKGNPLIYFALELRTELVKKFYKYIQDEDAAAFASTLILGYRAELSSKLIEAYSKTGTMHVLSVSGMHVGIVFLVLSAVLKFMDKNQQARMFRAFLIVSIIWFYALLTGFSAPVCRAAVMLSFIVLGKALNKHQNTYNLIAISAFFLLLYNPFYLLDAGFQLSYLAVTGLVYFHPKIYQTIYIKNKFLDYIWSYSALSVAAQLATFPFTIYYFHQFPVYFLFSNLFIVFPIAIIMYVGILFLFVPFQVVLYYIGFILNSLINFTNDILYFIENLPLSSWEGIWVNPFEFTLICLLVLSISFGLTFGFRKIMIPIAGFLLFLSCSFSLNQIRDYNVHQIIFLNLRRNTGIAYIFKGRSVIISDTDSSNKTKAFSILPTVKSKGSSSEMFYPVDSTYSELYYSANSNFYQFGSYRILRWNKAFDGKTFTKKLTVDEVLISGNPRATIKQIASYLSFTRIIIDGNNSDYNVERWSAESMEMNLRFYVLKKNPALIVNL